MTPPEWRRLPYSGGDEEPRRTVVLETLNGLTEIAFCPSDIAITHVDYDEADEYSRAGLKEDVAEAEVERARERAASTLDERAAIDVLAECRKLAGRIEHYGLRDRIDEILEPVTASFCEEGQRVSCEEYRHQRQAGEE